ncbi:MAG TPA: iron-sulfur cluster assembly accessory protein [Vicinamibacterales bacterium]|nr:iron-sulfur cluster assembly accessory protein [Vicinamibacterales bacterium]
MAHTEERTAFHISENAAQLIRKMTARQNLAGGGLRIGIKAGGCSGLSYTFAWEAAPRETDHVFEGADGARVFVDPKSFQFIKGTTLDYDTSLVSKGFIFNNPNAKSSCGCGTSFSV